MRHALAFLVAAGCSFQPADSHDAAPGRDAAHADARSGSDAGSGGSGGSGSSGSGSSGSGCSSCRRKVITIDHTKVSGGPLASFSVLISIATDADLAAHARATGTDLAFSLADGTPLPYEREAFTGSNGHLLAWVLVPSLSSTADTVLHLDYGDPTATETANGAAAWDSHTQGVWHLDEPSGSAFADSSATHDTATRAMNAPVRDGEIGGALKLSGPGDALEVPANANLTKTGSGGTFSAWVNFTHVTSSDRQTILASDNRFVGSGAGFEWAIEPDGSAYFYPNGAAEDFLLQPAPLTDGAWHHMAVTFDFAANTVGLYVDGAHLPLGSGTTDMTGSWTTVATPTGWEWGAAKTAKTAITAGGGLDEIHVSTTARTDGWIRTEFTNQSAPASFYRIVQD